MKKILISLLGLLPSYLCATHMDLDSEKKIAFARERNEMMKKNIEAKQQEVRTLQKSIEALKGDTGQLTLLTARLVQLNKEIADLVKESEITQNSMKALSGTK